MSWPAHAHVPAPCDHEEIAHVGGAVLCKSCLAELPPDWCPDCTWTDVRRLCDPLNRATLIRSETCPRHTPRRTA